ncbi:MAG: HPr family phosphocarrier protein [Acidobacteria bacterium]|nr:MAG: HPr family phosphocarrier protein [Acidobacteriota bacterium]
MRAERDVEIVNRLGLHARAAARFVDEASRFESRIELRREGEAADGKSILGLLTLAAARGSRLRLVAEGPDAEAAVAVLAELIASGFGEAAP